MGTIPLPNVASNSSSVEAEEYKFFNALTKAQQKALRYGVDRKFVKFALPEYFKDPEEQYGIHKFITLRVETPGCDPVELDYATQYTNVLNLLNDGHLWSSPAGLIVINSPYYLFNFSAEEQDRSADGFLAHLLCSLAHRVERGLVRPTVEVSFLETTSLDFSRDYEMKARHLFVYGPLTDHASPYTYDKAIQFLYAFRQHTRILLTSTLNLGELLSQLHMSFSYVTYAFNIDSGVHEKQETTKALKPKKERKNKPQREAKLKKTTKIKSTNSEDKITVGV